MTTPANTARMSIPEVDAKAYQPLYALEKYLHAGRLGEDLLALVKMRASQLNSCAYCLNLHAREARKAEVSRRSSTSSPAGTKRPGSTPIASRPRCA